MKKCSVVLRKDADASRSTQQDVTILKQNSHWWLLSEHR
jgi:hypothetical protein